MPLVMTEVEPWKEAELFISVRPEGERAWTKCVCGPDMPVCIQTLLQSSFVTALSRIGEAERLRESLFFLTSVF